MGFFKKNFGKKNKEEYYEEIQDQYADEGDYDDYGAAGYDEDYDAGSYDRDQDARQYEEPSVASRRSSGKSKVISMPEYTRPASAVSVGERDMKMVIFKPSSYDETESVIDSLRARKPIVVNLDEINPAVAQRILDFISGAVYALNGDIRRAARNIFVVAPSNIEISPNEADDDYNGEL